MKNLILGIALVGLAVSCKNNENNQISDPATANAPEACSTECASATECSTEKADCSAEKAECSAEKTECSTAKTCPVSGKVIEN
jgi:hypothetical protein